MRFGASRYLGLALGEKSLQAAELRLSGDRPELVRCAEWAYPAGLSLDAPQELGAALRQFLRSNKFSASSAVVGVPARWLLSREKDLPPTTPALAASALRMEAERQFPPELKELVFDYAGQADPAEARRVLLLAAPARQVEQVSRLADEAGLSLVGLTSSALAVSAAAGSPPASLVLGGDGAELVAEGHGAPRMLKHLGMAGALPAALAAQVQRTLAFLPQNGTSGDPLVVWDGEGAAAGQWEDMGQRMGIAVERARDLDRLSLSGGRTDLRFASAAALALAAAKPELLGVNFVRSRLSVADSRLSRRRAIWLGTLATLAAAALAFLMWDGIRQRKADLASLQGSLARIEPQRKEAAALAAKVSLARGWYELRPPFLPCMLELTSAFPQEGVIWASSLAMRDNRKGTLTGRATDQKAILAVLDRLKNNKNFADVKLMDMRDAGGSSREISFSIGFRYIAVEAAP